MNVIYIISSRTASEDYTEYIKVAMRGIVKGIV